MANSRSFLRRRHAAGNGRHGAGDAEVARIAYELYERRGRQDGHALDDWLEAERLVRRQQAARSPTLI